MRALTLLVLLVVPSVTLVAGAGPKSLAGCKYPAATAFVDKYCASCHTQGGVAPDAKTKKRAYGVLQLDTYEQWKADTKVITAVLDKWHLDGKIMPPAKAVSQPTDAERKAILDWLARGSPNTLDGK